MAVVDPSAPAGAGGRLVAWLRQRTLAGLAVRRYNQEVLAVARGGNFDLVWCDKAQLLNAGTIRALRAVSRQVVHYSSDLPSAVRGEAGWRLFRDAVPDYDAVIAPSDGHDAEYRHLGARRILHMPFGYEPAQHFPPPAGDVVEARHAVCFIGTPYGERAGFLRALQRDHGIRVSVFGDLWGRVLTPTEYREWGVQPGRYGDAYRETIWASKICLGFVTHEMAHGEARRWSEIAACGGFLLAERTTHSERSFVADREAVFFGDVMECAAAIRRYLDAPEARARIARAGWARVTGRRSNDVLMGEMLGALDAGG